MNINQYVRLVVAHRLYAERRWVLQAFAVVRSSEPGSPSVGSVIREPFGIFTITDSGEKVRIDDPSVGAYDPLLSKDQMVTITPDMFPGFLKETITTRLGTLLINLCCLYEPFGGKIPYQNAVLSPRALEKLIAPKIKPVPTDGSQRQLDFCYIDEVIRYIEAVEYLTSFADIFARTVSRQGLLPPPGRTEFRAKVLEKYKDRLDDPVVAAAYDKELYDFDIEYLKNNDPTFGKFMTGKPLGTRAKSFMSKGSEVDPFSTVMKSTTIIPSLEENIPLTREGFVAISNNIRNSSFARASETVNGGVVAKGIQGASDNWTIVEEFCGTTLSLAKVPTESDVEGLVGRNIRESGKIKKISTADEARTYIGRRVELMSPATCQSEGQTTCKVCAGDRLSTFRDGVQILLMGVSSGVLVDSLKKMHTSGIKTKRVVLSRIIS